MEQKYTLNEVAEMMRENKWHLLQLEQYIEKAIQNGYGQVTVRLDIRANSVEKMTIIQAEETLLKPKEGHPDNTNLTQNILENPKS